MQFLISYIGDISTKSKVLMATLSNRTAAKLMDTNYASFYFILGLKIIGYVVLWAELPGAEICHLPGRMQPGRTWQNWQGV